MPLNLLISHRAEIIALHRPIIPLQSKFKGVNSGANVFTPFYLNQGDFVCIANFAFIPASLLWINSFRIRFDYTSHFASFLLTFTHVLRVLLNSKLCSNLFFFLNFIVENIVFSRIKKSKWSPWNHCSQWCHWSL